MNESLESIFILLALISVATLLIRYVRHKRYNVNKCMANKPDFKTQSFKIEIEHQSKSLNAVMTILNQKISVSGDISIDIPFERIINIKFPYALNTVIYEKHNIIRNYANNFSISPHKLMSTLFITFFDDENKMITFKVVMQESEYNFRVNKIARIQFMQAMRVITNKGRHETR